VSSVARCQSWRAAADGEALGQTGMQRAFDRKMTARAHVASTDSDESGVASSCLRQQLDEVCMVLFDRWCERREVTPLLYLLHAWPFLPSTPHPIRLVSAALRDLVTFHLESLDTHDRSLIASVLSMAGE
jgi:hypothetical protein